MKEANMSVVNPSAGVKGINGSKVVPLVKRPTPSLKELAALDKDVIDFLRLVYEEDLREEAVRALNRAITAKRPIPMGKNQ